MTKPKHLDVKKDRGLTIHWVDGSSSFFPTVYLRKMSPAADQKKLREELASNPLSVLPASAVSDGEPLTIEDVKLVGHYAIQIRFSDQHDAGIYTWEYLFEIDPDRVEGTS